MCLCAYFSLVGDRKYQHNLAGKKWLSVFEISVNIHSCQFTKSPKCCFMNEAKAEIQMWHRCRCGEEEWMLSQAADVYACIVGWTISQSGTEYRRAHYCSVWYIACNVCLGLVHWSSFRKSNESGLCIAEKKGSFCIVCGRKFMSLWFSHYFCVSLGPFQRPFFFFFSLCCHGPCEAPYAKDALSEYLCGGTSWPWPIKSTLTRTKPVEPDRGREVKRYIPLAWWKSQLSSFLHTTTWLFYRLLNVL